MSAALSSAGPNATPGLLLVNGNQAGHIKTKLKKARVFCKSVARAKELSMKSNTRLVFAMVMAAAALMSTACTSGPSGTYSDANGAVLLELKSGGKANITFMGEVADCTDSTTGNQLTLDCKGPAGKMVFTIHDDGSLTGPPGGFMPMLRKQK